MTIAVVGYTFAITLAARSPQIVVKHEAFVNVFGVILPVAAFLFGIGLLLKNRKAPQSALFGCFSFVLFLIGTPALLVGAILGAAHFTRDLNRSVREQIVAIEREMEPLFAKLRASRFNQLTRTNSASVRPCKPFVILQCPLLSDNTPQLDSIELTKWWFYDSLGDLGRRLELEIVEPRPKFSPKTLIVVASEFRPSGNEIRLDNGTVPELRDYAIAFAFDVNSMELVWRSVPFMGAEAKTPTRHPGIQYYSAIKGDKIGPKEIDAALKRVRWCGAEQPSTNSAR